MEETNKTQKKLTYEELSKAASDLHIQYQKLLAEYNKAIDALRNRDFDYTSFFLQMLFKVLEHPEMYKDDFVKWATDNIQAALTTFAESMRADSAEPEKKEKGETE